MREPIDKGSSAYQQRRGQTTLKGMKPGQVTLIGSRTRAEEERMVDDLIGGGQRGMWLPGLAMVDDADRTMMYGTTGGMTTTNTEMRQSLKALKNGDKRPITKQVATEISRAGIWVERPGTVIDSKIGRRWADIGVSPARGEECAREFDTIETAWTFGEKTSVTEQGARVNEALGAFGIGKGAGKKKPLRVLWTREWKSNKEYANAREDIERHFSEKGPWVGIMPVWQGVVAICAGAIGHADEERTCPRCVEEALEWGPWTARTQWGDEFESTPQRSVARAMRSIEEESSRVATHIARCLAGHDPAAMLKWWPCDEARARTQERVGIENRCRRCATMTLGDERRWWEEDTPDNADAYLEREGRKTGCWTGHFTHLDEARGLGVNDGRWTFSWYTSRTARAGAIAIVAKLPGYRQHSGGKGSSPGGARKGAIAEAIERNALRWRCGTSYTRASANALAKAGRNIVTPDVLTRFSERQWAERDTINEQGYTYVEIPVRFEESDREREIAWVEYANVATIEPETILVPRTYTYFGAPTDIAEEGGWRIRRRENYCISDSNGVAAGPNRAEACARGFCELVERHGFALWWYNHVARPALEPGRFADPTIRDAPERMRKVGRELELLDASVTRALPIIIAVSWREPRLPGGEGDPIFSAGCGPSVEIAAKRAVTEHAQLSPSILRQWSSYYRQHRGPEFAKLKWWTGQSEPWLAHDPNQDRLGPEDYPENKVPQSRGFLERTKKAARALNTRYLAHDLLPHEREFSVVRVIAPELCHFWHRLGDRRLREEPAALGWTGRTRTESELNTVPVIL